MNTAKPQLPQERRSALIKLTQALHCKNHAAHAGQHRRLIARTRAYFQHAHAPARLQQLAHERNNIGLRNGLAVAYGQGRILIGLGPQGLLHKKMTRHAAHGCKHAAIRNAASLQLFTHHALTQASRVHPGLRNPPFTACKTTVIHMAEVKPDFVPQVNAVRACYENFQTFP